MQFHYLRVGIQVFKWLRKEANRLSLKDEWLGLIFDEMTIQAG